MAAPGLPRSAVAGRLRVCGWLFTPVLIENLLGNRVGVPFNNLILAAMMGVTAAAFFGLEALQGKTRTNAAGKWVAFAGYGAGVAIMVAAASAHSSLGVLAGLGVMVPALFASLFTGWMRDGLVGLYRRLAAHWHSRVSAARDAAGGMSVKKGVLVGFGIGAVAAIALTPFSPFFALAPLAGVVAGYLLTRRRG